MIHIECDVCGETDCNPSTNLAGKDVCLECLRKAVDRLEAKCD